MHILKKILHFLYQIINYLCFQTIGYKTTRSIFPQHRNHCNKSQNIVRLTRTTQLKRGLSKLSMCWFMIFISEHYFLFFLNKLTTKSNKLLSLLLYLCKILNRIQNIFRPTNFPQQGDQSFGQKILNIQYFFSVQDTRYNLSEPDPQKWVCNQDIVSPVRRVPSGLLMPF